MTKTPIYTIEGKEVGTLELPSLFAVPVDERLIHKYYLWVRNMLRHTIAHTKTRGDVSGGGKKPWKQKGTGRARSGSTRNPIWRHGGTVFGPNSDQTYATRMPRQERRKALFGALSAKANANNIIIFDKLELAVPKTKDMVAVLTAVPALTGKKVLHVHEVADKNLFASTRNIPRLRSTTVQEMNIIDILDHDVIMLTKDAVLALENHFTPTV
jgi:large subunit ribosomal protein L4